MRVEAMRSCLSEHNNCLRLTLLLLMCSKILVTSSLSNTIPPYSATTVPIHIALTRAATINERQEVFHREPLCGHEPYMGDHQPQDHFHREPLFGHEQSHTLSMHLDQ